MSTCYTKTKRANHKKITKVHEVLIPIRNGQYLKTSDNPFKMEFVKSVPTPGSCLGPTWVLPSHLAISEMFRVYFFLRIDILRTVRLCRTIYHIICLEQTTL